MLFPLLQGLEELVYAQSQTVRVMFHTSDPAEHSRERRNTWPGWAYDTINYAQIKDSSGLSSSKILATNYWGNSLERPVRLHIVNILREI